MTRTTTMKTKANIVEEQLEKMSLDLLAGKVETKISKEFHNNVGKRVAVANGIAKQTERGHRLANPFYGITMEMENDIRKPFKKTAKKK